MAELSTDFYIDENNYFYGWLQNSQKGYAGLYWESKEDETGSILYPKNRKDRFLRSLDESWVTREYVRWTLEDEIGFVNADGTWSFKTDKNKNAYVYNNLNITRNVTAEALYGDGFNLSNLDASKIKQGTLNKDRLPNLINASTTGNARTATSLAKEIKLSLSGDISGEISLDGSTDKNIEVIVYDDSHLHEESYYNKTISDNRFLGINATAVNADLLDGKDSTYFATDKALLEQKARIDDIMELSTTDLDSFREIVDLINSIDTENDEALATFSKNIIDSLNTEIQRAETVENEIVDSLNEEIQRAEITENEIELNLNNRIDEETSRAKEKENEIVNSLNKEIFRAQDSENTLTDNLNTEIERAKGEEQYLQDQIDNNNSKLTNDIKILDDKISTETLRATTAEGELNNKILAENARAVKAEKDIIELLEDETARALESEKTNDQNLTEEILRASQEEKRVLDYLNARIDTQRARIDDILNLSTTDADSFKEIVDLINSIDTENDEAFASFAVSTNTKIEDLNTKIEDETSRATDTENNLSDDIVNETIRAKQVEQDLQDQINENNQNSNDKDVILDARLTDEVQRAVVVEKDLLLKINDEIDRATKAELDLDTKFTDSINTTNNSISVLEAKTILAINEETDRAKTAENQVFDDLSGRIKAEEQLARINENNLGIRIDDTGTKIEDEISRAILREDDLQEQINENNNHATTVENDLLTKLNDLISSNKEEHDDINLRLNNETLRSIEKDNNLNDAINIEVQRASTKEKDLEKAIEAEKVRINDILNLSTTDADSFKEIVDLINNVDIINDQAFGNFVSSTNQELDTIRNDLDNEIQRATAIEDELDTRLTNETLIARTAEDDLNTKLNTTINLLNDEVQRAIAAKNDRYTKAESDEKFLGINDKAQDSYRLNGQTAEDFKEAYLAAVGDPTANSGTTTSSYVIQKDDCTVYWDEDKTINFITLTNSPVGDIIDLTITTTTGENITINDKVNQIDKRIEFLDDTNLNNSTAYCTYLRYI
jgi:ribosomal protein S25